MSDAPDTNKRNRIVGAVVSALAAGATVIGAYVAASAQEQVTVPTVQDTVRASIVDAAVALRSMGYDEAGVVAATVQRTNGPPDQVGPVARGAFGRRDRDPRSLRSVAAVVPVAVADAPAAWASIAEAHCAPLRLAGNSTDLHAECMDRNAVEQGAAMCLADGTPAGWVVRQQVTAAHAERLGSLIAEVPATWTTCPQALP